MEVAARSGDERRELAARIWTEEARARGAAQRGRGATRGAGYTRRRETQIRAARADEWSNHEPTVERRIMADSASKQRGGGKRGNTTNVPRTSAKPVDHAPNPSPVNLLEGRQEVVEVIAPELGRGVLRWFLRGSLGGCVGVVARLPPPARATKRRECAHSWNPTVGLGGRP